MLLQFIGVRKAKRAAEEAQKSAREAVQRLRAQLLIDDISTGLQHVRAIDSACRELHWKEAIHQSDEARSILVIIQEHHAILSIEKDSIVKAVDFLGTLIIYINKMRSKETEIDEQKSHRGLSEKRSKQLHEIIIHLGKILGRLRNQPFEV